MCRWCWEEEGSPRDLPEGSQVTVDLIEQLYAREDGDTGGMLHVTLDDFNTADNEIQGGMDFFRENAEQHFSADTIALCEQIFEQLMAMTEPQRIAVIAKAQGYFRD